MKMSVAALSLMFVLSSAAHAQTPPEVLAAYTAYNTSMSAKDYQEALSHGKTAWQAAEKQMKNSKTTGDLAFNYGFLAKSQGKVRSAMPALERAVELADIDREKGAAVRLERSVELVAAAELIGDSKAVKKYADKALKNANSNALGNSVYAGEILVHKAQECSKVANRAAGRVQRSQNSAGASRMAAVTGDNSKRTARLQKKCAKDAQKAAVIFKNNPNLARPKYVALAANQVGIGYEREGQWLEAAMSYQTARLSLEDKFGRENPVVMQMIGRWINARARLDYGDKLEKAKAAGLCDCWPYDKRENKVDLVQAAKMDLPTRIVGEIQSSGVVVASADITDAGAASNIKVLYSWPQGQYDDKAIKAFQKFQYAPKVGEEVEGMRKAIVETFSVNVVDDSSNKTY